MFGSRCHRQTITMFATRLHLQKHPRRFLPPAVVPVIISAHHSVLRPPHKEAGLGILIGRRLPRLSAPGSITETAINNWSAWSDGARALDSSSLFLPFRRDGFSATLPMTRLRPPLFNISGQRKSGEDEPRLRKRGNTMTKQAVCWLQSQGGREKNKKRGMNEMNDPLSGRDMNVSGRFFVLIRRKR